MSRYLFTIIVLLFGGTPNLAAQQAFQDAVQLAARMATDLNESAELSGDLIADLTVALEAIQQHETEAAQIVTRKLNIRAFAYANTKNLRIYLDATTKWAEKLARDKNELEQTPLREWSTNHNLYLGRAEITDGIIMLELNSKSPKNMRYIANKVSLINDVLMVEVPAPDGDGHDIQAKRTHNGWMISYIYKYENCFSHCKKQYQWQFGVTHEGAVEFLGAYGEIPPILLEQTIMVMEDEELD